ncbi:MAG: NAD-dependent epimerase/dehydratase family protein [Bacteroidia bacterium]
MRILITGGAGYIGSVLTNLALQRGHTVTAVDALWFNEQIPLIHLNNPNYTFHKGDIGSTTLMEPLCENADFIIHTAAVVGDPASKLFPELTTEVNEKASIRLIKTAQKAGVKGFIFFSTCSNYGVANDLATEDTPLQPLSLYAESKVNVERYLMEKPQGLDGNWPTFYHLRGIATYAFRFNGERFYLKRLHKKIPRYFSTRIV